MQEERNLGRPHASGASGGPQLACPGHTGMLSVALLITVFSRPSAASSTIFARPRQHAVRITAGTPSQFNSVSVIQRDTNGGRAAHQGAPPGLRYKHHEGRCWPRCGWLPAPGAVCRKASATTSGNRPCTAEVSRSTMPRSAPPSRAAIRSQ